MEVGVSEGGWSLGVEKKDGGGGSSGEVRTFSLGCGGGGGEGDCFVEVDGGV